MKILHYLDFCGAGIDRIRVVMGVLGVLGVHVAPQQHTRLPNTFITSWSCLLIFERLWDHHFASLGRL